jgi:fimbrial chaperone protein
MTMRSAASLAILAWLLLATPVCSRGASLLIWPLDPTIEAGQKTGVLWLENVGTTTVNLQLRVVAWEQEGFTDRYREQSVLIGTPPFATIAPGKKQFVRFTLLEPVPARQERAFRILVDELPTVEATTSAATLKLQMRYSLPLFAYGEGAWRKPSGKSLAGRRAEPSLMWKLVEEGSSRYLQISNTGVGHARLSRVRFIRPDQVATSANPDVIEVAAGLLGYVLPGRTMRWPAPAGASPDLQLEAQLEASAPSAILPRE